MLNQLIKFFFIGFILLASCSKILGPSGAPGDTSPTDPYAQIPAANKGIVVKQNGKALFNNSFDFGSVNRTGSAGFIFEIYNNNSYDVTLTNSGSFILIEGSSSFYSITEQPASPIIPAKGSVYFKVVFLSAGAPTLQNHPSNIHIPNSAGGDLIFALNARTKWHILSQNPNIMGSTPIVIPGSSGADSPFGFTVDKSTGTPYLVYHKANTLYCYKYNYTSYLWESIGTIGTGLVLGTGALIKMIYYNNQLYIIVMDGTPNFKVYGFSMNLSTGTSTSSGMITDKVYSVFNIDLFIFNNIPHLSVLWDSADILIFSYNSGINSWEMKSQIAAYATSPTTSLVFNNKLYITHQNGIGSEFLWEYDTAYSKTELPSLTPPFFGGEIQLNESAGVLSLSSFDNTNSYFYSEYSGGTWSTQNIDLQAVNTLGVMIENMVNLRSDSTSSGLYGIFLADFSVFTKLVCAFNLKTGKGFSDTTTPIFLWPLPSKWVEYSTDGKKTHYAAIRHDDSVTPNDLKGIIVLRMSE